MSKHLFANRRFLNILTGMLIGSLVLMIVSITIVMLTPRNQRIAGSDFEGVIFHESQAEGILQSVLLSETGDEAYWRPTKVQVQSLEAQLSVFVEEEMPGISAMLPIYQRQYFGFRRDGVRLIYVVGFCEPVPVDWGVELVSLVMAYFYFEAQFDIERGEFVYFWELSER